MRRGLSVVVAVFALASLARGEEPKRPPGIAELAAVAKKAFDAKDEAAIAGVAKTAGQGSWPVVDRLFADGRADVAEAVAGAFDGPSKEALRAYVEREKALPPDRAARTALRAAEEAFRARDYASSLEAVAGITGRGLAGVQLLVARALALSALGRHEEAAAAHVETARLATELGWHAGAVQAWQRATLAAQRRDDVVGARALQREVVASARRSEDDAILAAALIDLASMLGEGDPELPSVSDEGIALARRIGHRAYLANALVNLGVRRLRGGDVDGAKAALDEGLALQEEVGDAYYAARAKAGLGAVARRKGDLVLAERLVDEAARAQEKLRDFGGACSSLESLIDIAVEAGDHARARERADQLVALATKARLADHRAVGLGARAMAELAAGHPDEALATVDAAVEEARRTKRTRTVASTLLKQSSVRFELAEYVLAEASAREAAALSASIGDRLGQVRALTILGNVLGRVGDGEGSVAAHLEVHAYHATRGVTSSLAIATGNVGYAYSAFGKPGEALTWTLRARDLWLALGDRHQAAQVLQNVAAIHLRLGDIERARSTLRLAADEIKTTGDVAARASVLVNLGALAGTPEDPEAGRPLLEEALGLARTAGARLWEFNALSNLAQLEDEAGRLDAARARYAELLERSSSMKIPRERACTFASLASIELRRGDPAAALVAAESASTLAAQSDDPWDRAVADAAMASALADLHRPAEALERVRTGTRSLAASLVGVPTTLGVSSSGVWLWLRGAGLQAARDAKDVAAAFEVSERSRAGQVLEWLGGRSSLGDVGVPPALAAEEQKHRAALLTAQARLARARAGGEMATIRTARTAVEQAEAVHLEAVGRIQLEARRAASVVFPDVPSLPALQAKLPEGTVFVAYAIDDERVVALVVERGGARSVDLGAGSDLDEKVAPLLAALADGHSTDADAELARAREALVAPLALGERVKRLVVAPDRVLAYVPFAALLPDRTVSLVASATAWQMLADGREARGEGVVALGDPVYGGASPREAASRAAGGTAGDVSLLPLPATRAEAKAVGTTVLLGADATEASLEKALATKRWRAVHLACHGLVDEQNPMRSSLALSSDAEHDGYLRVAEVYGMRIPADLVVLSACESGRGRAYTGAGVVGFTGAFLLAGASRVVCSLWKVDDEATQALMREFYELWNPADGQGLPAAEALRAAQASIRATERWRHPYYWAAWVLWGVPD